MNNYPKLVTGFLFCLISRCIQWQLKQKPPKLVEPTGKLCNYMLYQIAITILLGDIPGQSNSLWYYVYDNDYI